MDFLRYSQGGAYETMKKCDVIITYAKKIEPIRIHLYEINTTFAFVFLNKQL